MRCEPSVAAISSQTESAYRRDLTNWATLIADIAGKSEIEAVKSPESREKADPFVLALARLDIADLSLGNVKRALAQMARLEYAPASRGRMLAAPHRPAGRPDQDRRRFRCHRRMRDQPRQFQDRDPGAREGFRRR